MKRVPQDKLVIAQDYGEDGEPNGLWQVLYMHQDGTLETPIGGADTLTLEAAGELMKSGRIFTNGPEPVGQPSVEAEAVKVYLVTVKAETEAQCEQVMRERISPDEDYGFDYTIGYEEEYS